MESYLVGEYMQNNNIVIASTSLVVGVFGGFMCAIYHLHLLVDLCLSKFESLLITTNP